MNYQPPRRIISGGQTGADRGGLDAAIALSIPIGGYCNDGRRAEDGRIPDRYTLTTIPGKNYELRTRRNVLESDATIIFNAERALSSGSLATKKIAVQLGKPVLAVHGAPIPSPTYTLTSAGTTDPCDGSAPDPAADRIAATIAAFLLENRPAVLNIAGNRESVAPGMQVHVATVIHRAISLAITRSREELEQLANPIAQPRQMRLL